MHPTGSPLCVLLPVSSGGNTTRQAHRLKRPTQATGSQAHRLAPVCAAPYHRGDLLPTITRHTGRQAHRLALLAFYPLGYDAHPPRKGMKHTGSRQARPCVCCSLSSGDHYPPLPDTQGRHPHRLALLASYPLGYDAHHPKGNEAHRHPTGTQGGRQGDRPTGGAMATARPLPCSLYHRGQYHPTGSQVEATDTGRHPHRLALLASYPLGYDAHHPKGNEAHRHTGRGDRGGRPPTAPTPPDRLAPVCAALYHRGDHYPPLPDTGRHPHRLALLASYCAVFGSLVRPFKNSVL